MSVPAVPEPTTGHHARYADAPALDRRRRAGVALAVALFHALAIWAIVRGLGGIAGLPDRDDGPRAVAAFDVPLDKPSAPPPARADDAQPQGAEGATGRKAKPREIVARPARLPSKAPPAAPAASTGNDTRSGAASAGEGTGGGAQGGGTGIGGAGSGAGGRYAAQKAVKIAGDITSTRDYPRGSRDARLGTSVIVALVVGVDGRVRDCTVRKHSGDPEADAITCRLAIERFRFRPARDQDGQPMETVYGWEQRFFAP